MKVTSYILYALWVVSAIVLKILGLISWWVATSWLWIPLSVALCAVVTLEITVHVGERLQKKEDEKIPDSCQVCLFGQAKELSPDDKCLGCVMDENHNYGELCSQYKRNIRH